VEGEDYEGSKFRVFAPYYCALSTSGACRRRQHCFNLQQSTLVADRATLRRCSAEPWQANLIKLLGNMMTATALEMMAEVVTLARKRGLDPGMFMNIMTSTMFSGHAHKIYGTRL
jgi:hypothetical protein